MYSIAAENKVIKTQHENWKRLPYKHLSTTVYRCFTATGSSLLNIKIQMLYFTS